VVRSEGEYHEAARRCIGNVREHRPGD
jgi:hypothetical protein